jgi:hypothetical protein
MILGTKDWLIPKYVDGSKLHSIRQDLRWKVGMDIQFYAKCRQVTMHKIMPDGVCKSIQRVFMTFDGCDFEVTVGNRYLSPPDILTLAKNDGFETIEQFRDFFFPNYKKKDEFSGIIIHWTDLKY